MARIVYFTNGMASAFNSSLELSRRLTEAGHEVTYVSHIDLSAAVESHGFSFFLLQECDRIRDQFLSEIAPLRKQGSLANLFRIAKLGLAARRKSASSEEIPSLVNEVDADLLLIDFEMHYAILATRQLKVPTLLLGVWFSIFYSPELPPMHTELEPATDLVGKLRIKFAWYKLFIKRLLEPLGEIRPSRLKRRLFPVSYGTNHRNDLKLIARSQNARFSAHASRLHWAKPHTYCTIPMLSFNVREMDLEHSVHPMLRYVGPMIQQNRLETKTSAEEMSRWSGFRDRYANQQRKLIYCSLGTFWETDTRFLSKVIEAFRDSPDKSLVVGLGGKSQAKDFGAVPDNVLLMQYAPQLSVLKHADVAITHGGITTINECISHGVPMLVCSTGYVDQPGCAVRVRHHGLGQLLNIKSPSSSNIKKQLNSLLADTKTQNRVDSMRENFERHWVQNTAVEIIESLMQNDGSPAT